MTDVKFCDEKDLKILSQIIDVYKVKMFNNGMYIPKEIQRAINHFQLSMSELK